MPSGINWLPFPETGVFPPCKTLKQGVISSYEPIYRYRDLPGPCFPGVQRRCVRAAGTVGHQFSVQGQDVMAFAGPGVGWGKVYRQAGPGQGRGGRGRGDADHGSVL